MTMEVFLIWLAIGALAGWLAGLIVDGGGFGLLGNIVVGIIGSFVAGWLFPRLGLHIGGPGILGHIINAAIGGVIVSILHLIAGRRD